MGWRPDKREWDKMLLAEIKKIPDLELMKGDVSKAFLLFAEAGADALWDALWEAAEESPTKTFTIDTRDINVFTEEVKRNFLVCPICGKEVLIYTDGNGTVFSLCPDDGTNVALASPLEVDDNKKEVENE